MTSASDACHTLDELAHEHFDRAVFTARVDGRGARHAATATPLAPRTQEKLHARGVDAFYTHQATAIDALVAGRSVVVASAISVSSWNCS